MEPSFDVVALGELLIDFTENGVSAQGNTLFEACPGGAPCNVLAMLRKLGRSCAFVGKVGDDLFGRLLKGVLEDVGISTQALLKLPKGTEHFMSDLHGENEAFVHILNSASGVIREKVDLVLGSC